jgi:hypothetical protein
MHCPVQPMPVTCKSAIDDPSQIMTSKAGIALNAHYEGDGRVIFKHACKLGCEGIVSKRLGSPYRSGRSDHWLKIKNPAAPAVRREAEEDWDRRRKQPRAARP